MKVCIDAGHGGIQDGATGTDPFKLKEKDFNLSLALRLEEELEGRGHWVVMTRRQDRTLALEARAAFANRLQAELSISIHANGAVQKKATAPRPSSSASTPPTRRRAAWPTSRTTPPSSRARSTRPPTTT